MADAGQAGSALARPAASQADAWPGSVLANARGWLLGMPSARRNKLGAALLLIAAVCAGMVWYTGRPDWRILYSGLDSKDVQQVAQELTAAGIASEMTEDGSGIEVSADQLDRARMEVATKGMPQTGRMGFELFDKPNWVGSEFDEKVNYQRALEGELEHTIGTLSAVRAARVHLVLPKDSEFGEPVQQAKASVVLQLRRSSMPPEQVEAIRSLVAGAVENLNANDVTLVDADGHMNLAAPTGSEIASDAERSLEEKLVAVLEPMTGPGNVRATVNVSYDESSEEKTDEVYDPTQVAALTQHKSEQTTGSAKSRASGIPGTASNTPESAASGKAAAVPPLMQPAAGAAGAAANANLPVYPQNGQAGDGQTITDESGTYAVTRHLTHLEQGPGRVRRVTAAVVVNDRSEVEGAGKQAHAVWKPRSADEMQRLQQLARAAVGFETTRGDEVVIENIGFSSNAPEPPPTTAGKVMDEADGLLHTPGILKTASFALLGLLLLFAVLKPLSRQVITTLSQTPAALPASTATPSSRQGVFGGSDGNPALANFPRPDAQGVYQFISEQIRKEPTQSTRLLESWINAPEENQ